MLPGSTRDHLKTILTIKDAYAIRDASGKVAAALLGLIMEVNGMRARGFLGTMTALGALTGTVFGTLAGCGGEVVVDQPDPARPVRIQQIRGGEQMSERGFPARIAASQRAELAFRLSGLLQELLVREGDEVKEGQVLARLDPTDFNLVLRDRQARYDNARRNFDRAQELIVGGNISKLDFDTMETTFKTAGTDLATARQNLEYTELRAPFSGTVTRRFVQQFEEVLAKMTVLNLQNLTELEVKVDVTEGLVRMMRDDPNRRLDPDSSPPAIVEFANQPDTRFPLLFKEAATEADPQTQTFEVTFTMSAPEEFRVLPGMTATVKVNFRDFIDVPSAYWIPAAAVVADSNLSAQVWIYDDGVAVQRSVTVGGMADDRIEVLEGLNAGDEVITLGAAFLAEGMRVFPMEESEQAVPRQDDPV
jgi:RND family efflux transporter MFP subunit